MSDLIARQLGAVMADTRINGDIEDALRAMPVGESRTIKGGIYGGCACAVYRAAGTRWSFNGTERDLRGTITALRYAD